jgi:mRNA interferase MazF
MKWKVVEMSLTLQEQLVGISKEIFKNNSNIDAKHIEIEMNKEDKEHRVKKLCGYYVHSNINSEVAMSNQINYNKNNGGQQIEVKQYEIWQVNLGEGRNSIQGGIRPFLITSNMLSTKYSPNVSGCSITSRLQKAKLPVHVELNDYEKYGLKKKSIILAETLCQIDKKTQLLYKIGSIDDEDIMDKVEEAIRIQNARLKPKTPLEKLDKKIQILIEEKLEDIRSVERTITNIRRESLIKHLMSEREVCLLSLERICNKYNLDYKDYYVMYRKEEEKIVI